ncbi:MAG: biotin synthase [Sulfurospirillum sp.]|nr:biotin synthase [Sulfurospirillum sp.]
MRTPIFLCSICNVSSGSCSEDCAFCSQSAFYEADIQRYKFKSMQEILEEAKYAKAHGAIGFCLVTAGKGLDKKKLEYISEAVKTVKEALPDFENIIACNGTASLEQLKILKEAGATSYNHNLESSREFYPNIVTSHSWDERYQTCLHVKQAGLNLVCGGIFGLGESEADRISFVAAIKSLQPMVVPINFFHPNDALPIKEKPLDIDKALELITYVRHEMPEAIIMVAGGREFTFGARQAEIFGAGANSIVIGNYLTTQGNLPDADIAMIHSLGLGIAKTCHG